MLSRKGCGPPLTSETVPVFGIFFDEYPDLTDTTRIPFFLLSGAKVRRISVISKFFVHRFIIYPQSFFIVHRLSQIILFWHGNPRLFQRHGLAPHWYFPRHFVVMACFASSRLSYIFQYSNFSIFQYFILEPCLYFSIAFMQIKPFPCGAQPCLF